MAWIVSVGHDEEAGYWYDASGPLYLPDPVLVTGVDREVWVARWDGTRWVGGERSAVTGRGRGEVTHYAYLPEPPEQYRLVYMQWGAFRHGDVMTNRAYWSDEGFDGPFGADPPGEDDRIALKNCEWHVKPGCMRKQLCLDEANSGLA